MEDYKTMLMEEGFRSLTGKPPTDILGVDWEKYIDDYMDDSERFHEGHLRGGCFVCKMD